MNNQADSHTLMKGEHMQAEPFCFSEANLAIAKKIVSKYPAEKKRSAVLPLLDLAQRQSGNWLPKHAMDYVAEMLGLAPIRVYEVASFFTMFNKEPVGEHFIQVCRTTPCWLRGSDRLTNFCKQKLGIDIGQTTNDEKFTLVEVECLGACVNAPMVQINDHYYEDLNEELLESILDDLASGKEPKVGSQIGRQCSAPINKIDNR